MRSRQFTQAEEIEIISAYTAGASVKALAESRSTGWTQIARVLRAHGVYEGQERQARTAKESEICSRYAAGESLAQLAAAYGCSHSWVLKILKKHDVERRPTGAPTPSYVPQIRELREQGLGARRIAKQLGVSVTTVQKWLGKWGMASPLPRGHEAGPAHPTWGGGAGVVAGYRYVWVPLDDPMRVMAWKSKGSVPEHRLVMARSIGRPLTRRETVHHINGNTLDNRLENLQLRNGQHGKGVAMTCLDCGSHNVEATKLK